MPSHSANWGRGMRGGTQYRPRGNERGAGGAGPSLGEERCWQPSDCSGRAAATASSKRGAFSQELTNMKSSDAGI